MTDHAMNRRDFLRTTALGALGMAGAAGLWRLAESPAFGEGEGDRPPNIVFILADDLGYDLLSCYGSDQFETPNTDALAAGGTRFRYCHTSPVCGPSRCQLMTGQYPFRSSHVENDGRVASIDPTGLPSVARVLKGAGYVTALCGKWHMSRKPQDWGFDEVGVQGGGHPQGYWSKQGDKTVFKPDLMHDWAVGFIQRNSARPFFLKYSMHLPHADLSYTPDSAPETVAQCKDRNLDPSVRKALGRTIMADNIAYMDKLVGKLMAELERLKLRDNTLVVFAGDNGTGGSWTIGGRRLAGAKRSLQDGGATVPMIACWPGTTPAGKVCDDLVGFEDFLPTFADVAGAPPPADKVLDGVSCAPQLRGQQGKPREWIFTQYRDQWFVRDQRRKLYNDGRLVDTSDYPYKEAVLPADAEPELRRKFQLIAEHLGVDKAMKAHPEWLPNEKAAG
jgi:arylsulfatase A